MRKKAFTILEIVVAIVIVGVLGTLGIPAFQNVIENSKDKVCTTNLKTLQKGLDIYILEQGTVPGSLSELKREHLEKAYAQIMNEKGAWKIRLAYFIVEGPKWGLAYAQADYLPRLRCPKNPDTSPTAISYGLNDSIDGISGAAYKLLPANTITIADSDSGTIDYINPAGHVVPGKIAHFLESSMNRAHKRNNWGNIEAYLKGVDRNGGTVRISNYIYPDSYPN